MGSERALARRLKWEREARGWTYDGLASRMTAAGCPIQGSALFKVEKSDPPRRITVDELVALARVLRLPILGLLTPIEVVLHKEIDEIATREREAQQLLGQAVGAAFDARVARLNLRRRAEEESNVALQEALDAWEEERQHQLRQRWPDPESTLRQFKDTVERLLARDDALPEKERERLRELFWATDELDAALDRAASAYLESEA